MAEVGFPGKGGYRLHPFGCAQFIRDFLAGDGPRYGAVRIDPKEGAPQADIHNSYKLALHTAIAEDMVAEVEERRILKGRPPLTIEEADRLRDFYLRERIPARLTRARYHSFLVYFGLLKRLDWVEPTGKTESSEVQEKMALQPGEPPREAGRPRVYYRLTTKGRRATELEIHDPVMTLYGYSRAQRSGKRYRYFQARPLRS